MSLLNRALATLLALALFLGGLLVVVDVVLVQLERPAFLVPTRQWSNWLSGQTYGAGIVRTICVGLVLLGLLLLVVALHRGRPRALTLPAEHDGVRVTASRRGLERMLSAAAGRVDGVESARVTVGRRRVRVIAMTPLRDPGDLQDRVATVISGQLAALGLTDLRPRLTVSRKGAR